jgi:uncharacterized protein DUF779
MALVRSYVTRAPSNQEETMIYLNPPDPGSKVSFKPQYENFIGSPMCYPEQEFELGGSDVLLGEIGVVRFYMSAAQFEYWKHTQLIIDVVPGRGGMFSLEGPEGLRFLT